MNEKYLLQKRLFERKKFIIEDDYIIVVESSLLGSNKYNVYYESIPNDRREVTISYKPFFWIAIGLIGLDILLLIISLIEGAKINSYFSYIAIILIILWAITRQAYIVFSDGNGVAFLKTKKAENELEIFIKVLFKKRDEYLFLKYGSPSDEIFLIEELERISFLYERKLLKKEEFQKLKRNLISQTEPKIGSIGFKPDANDDESQISNTPIPNNILPKICYCSECGEQLELEPTEQKNRKFECPECNHLNDRNKES